LTPSTDGNDCDCLDEAERRIAERNWEPLSKTERWALVQGKAHMDALQQKVDHLIKRVDEMYATLYNRDSGVLKKQDDALVKLNWTRVLLVGIAGVIGFGLTTALGVVTLMQMLHR